MLLSVLPFQVIKQGKNPVFTEVKVDQLPEAKSIEM